MQFKNDNDLLLPLFVMRLFYLHDLFLLFYCKRFFLIYKKRITFVLLYFTGISFSLPPMYGLNTSGIVRVPSSL